VDQQFTSNEVPLSQMLNQAATGKLQLPDFQRGWVWDDSHIASLLASISLSYPIGAVMTLETGNPDVRFLPRPLEGVELSTSKEPGLLLLDGQQRITSLYFALKSRDPVPTRDARGASLKRHYYADINVCINPDADREYDGIIGVPGDKRITTDFGREVLLDLSTRASEIDAEMFPLDIVLDPVQTSQWSMAYAQTGPGNQTERMEKWNQFILSLIMPFQTYQVPTIQLVKETPKEAVCQVFEKVNTGGVSLSVFELLTATYAVDDFRLRDDWAGRRERFSKHRLLGRFEATDFLQVVTLLATYERRSSYIESASSSEKAPAVSCKRRDVLRLRLDEYKKWTELSTTALERAASFIHHEHVFSDRDLPYATQLVPLAAIMALLGDLVDTDPNLQRLRQWYWCGVLGEMYGGSTETRFANDVQDVVAWLTGDGREPRTVREAQFQADRLLTLRSRNSAAYKGLYALQMKRGGRDFRTGDAIDAIAYYDDNIEIHHIFPKRWCDEKKYEPAIADCIVNKTAIDAHTNRRIGGSAPSAYLQRIESVDGMDPQDLDAILRSHAIDPTALRQDDFETFFNQRFEMLLTYIEEAMGKPVNRAADRSESPFVNPPNEPERVEAGVRGVAAVRHALLTALTDTSGIPAVDMADYYSVGDAPIWAFVDKRSSSVPVKFRIAPPYEIAKAIGARLAAQGLDAEVGDVRSAPGSIRLKVRLHTPDDVAKLRPELAALWLDYKRLT
jgi:hypothetical protein